MTRTLIAVAAVLVGVLGYVHAQSPLPAAGAVCGQDEVWFAGKPGADVTVSGLRIPPAARRGMGVEPVMFCVRGAVISADEMTMVARDGTRTFTLSGSVTLTLPDDLAAASRR